MTAAEMVDFNVERLVRLDERVDAAEGDGLRARWEFGRRILPYRDESGRLPYRFMADLVERTGKSRSELSYRVQFAEKYPTEEELSNALDTSPSWRDIVQTFKAERPAQGRPPADVVEAAPGEYATFVVDPPWQYGNTSTRGAAEDHYPTMTIEELCALDVVPTHAADQAHLYLWTTAAHLPEAFRVMAAWGFDYKTYLVWVKPQMGMGNYFRISTELVLFGVRGSLRTRDRAIVNHFEARRGKHSAKPAAFLDLVMKASPGPYMELFSRCSASEFLHGCQCSKCRLGWATWGNQAGESS